MPSQIAVKIIQKQYFNCLFLPVRRICCEQHSASRHVTPPLPGQLVFVPPCRYKDDRTETTAQKKTT